MSFERFAFFIAFDFVEIGQKIIERVELLEQLCGRFHTDTWYAGNIVGCISCKREQINNLIRSDSPIGQECGFVHGLLFADVEETHMRADELACIFVGRADGDIETLFDTQPGEGGDDIVRF